ncbi:hypothetical protein QFZ83_001681 [Variovorax sp. W1I1]|nr:hypothetical protein [Variovorax sp. W1I1]
MRGTFEPCEFANKRLQNSTAGIIGSAPGEAGAPWSLEAQAVFPSEPKSRRITATPATSAFE